jgi:hypothetical protein
MCGSMNFGGLRRHRAGDQRRRGCSNGNQSSHRFLPAIRRS